MGCCGGGRTPRLRQETTHRFPTKEGMAEMTIRIPGQGEIKGIFVLYTGPKVGAFSGFADSGRMYRFRASVPIEVHPNDVASFVGRLRDFRLAGGPDPLARRSPGQVIRPKAPRPVARAARPTPQVPVSGPARAAIAAREAMAEHQGVAPVPVPIREAGADLDPMPARPSGVGDSAARTELERTLAESDPAKRAQIRATKRETKVEDRGTRRVRVGPGI